MVIAIIITVIVTSIIVALWVTQIEKTDTKPFERCMNCPNVWCLNNPDECKGGEDDDI